MKKYFFSSILYSSSLLLSSENPVRKTLHLHFDVNKTIIALDTALGKDLEETVNCILAEFTFEKWDGIRKQSYYAFLTDKIAQENINLSRADEIFKHKRTERLKEFPQYLNTWHPQLHVQYQDDKKRMLETLGKEKMVIFPSFFKVITWLNAHHPNQFALYLRTFGKDLPEVIPLIENTASLKFANQGKFTGTTLTVGSTTHSIPEFFKNPQLHHYALQDDYPHWKSHGFQTSGGKPFPIDRDQKDIISVFFDDNADDPDKPIICPLNGNQKVENTNELLAQGNIVAVNPKEAILNEDYFINKIQALLNHSIIDLH